MIPILVLPAGTITEISQPIRQTVDKYYCSRHVITASMCLIKLPLLEDVRRGLGVVPGILIHRTR